MDNKEPQAISASTTNLSNAGIKDLLEAQRGPRVAIKGSKIGQTMPVVSHKAQEQPHPLQNGTVTYLFDHFSRIDVTVSYS